MAEHRTGELHWIDHFVVPTSDIGRWRAFAETVLGATEPWGDTEHSPPGDRPAAVFRNLGGCHIAAFAQRRPIPASKGLGVGGPRYGMYIRQEDVDTHARRLDQLGVTHARPAQTDRDGESGVVIPFEDADQNQLELWAPDRMPDGAMDGCSELGVGRISHAIFESRDLAQTSAFYTRYFGIAPKTDADVAEDTLVFPLAAGNRIVFKRVDRLSERTGGAGKLQGPHVAYTIRDDEFMPTYERLWAELGEWERDAAATDGTEDTLSLPARTGMHGSEAGRAWKKLYGRGDAIIDWDANNFHLVGATSDDPSFATYEAHYMETKVAALQAQRAGS